jgi:acetyltransferase-like isoleucine patch superfamily enzyme
MHLTKIYYDLIYYFKAKWLVNRGASIGRNVKIYGKLIVKYPKNLVIGDNTTINDGTLINCKGGVIIGDNCRISSGSQIHSTGLETDKFPRNHFSDKIIIEDDVWIGSSCVITKGVTIGCKTTVSALTLVNKDLESLSIYGGIPAKKIKKIEIKY